MGFALLAYQGLPGANANTFDLTAVPDQEFSQRNNHYIFTEPYRLFAAAHFEASALRSNFSCPTWNAIGKPNIWPVNVSANVPSPGPPRIDIRDYNPPPIPVNEEFQFQVTNNLGAATEQAWGIIWIVTNDWSANLPQGSMPIMVRATVTFTTTSLVWSGPQSLTFEQSLRGGVYAVIGAECFAAGVIAFRLVFPRYRMYQGRRLRPGWLCQQAVGDNIWPQSLSGPFELGEFGRFHTFEPPQIEAIMTTGGATTFEFRLWLVFLGENVGLLSGGLGGGPAGQIQQGVGY